MLTVAVVLLGTVLPPSTGAGTGAAGTILPLWPTGDERELHLSPLLREPTKKEHWLAEKAGRPDVHLTDEDLRPPRPSRAVRPPTGASLERVVQVLASPRPRPGTRVLPVVTLFHQWTLELLPLLEGFSSLSRFDVFMRDHFTQQPTQMDPRLLHILVASALRFRAQRIDVISGFRAPKYNLMLRKKGRNVARESQHTLGAAMDFRVRGTSARAVRDFVRSLRVGGVGLYTQLRFVHVDTGPVRQWQGS